MEGVDVHHSAVGGGGGTIQVREGTIQCIKFCFLYSITGLIDSIISTLCGWVGGELWNIERMDHVRPLSLVHTCNNCISLSLPLVQLWKEEALGTSGDSWKV